MKRLLVFLTSVLTALGVFNLVGLRGRARRPRGGMFFYSPVANAVKIPTGSMATLSSDSFAIRNTFSVFHDFNFVTSAASNGTKWLLFRRSDGAGCTAFIDRNYVLNVKKYYPPGHFANWPWWHVSVDGRGYLLLMGRRGNDAPSAGGKLDVGFAQVLDDGTYEEWWRTLLPMELPTWVVGLPSGHALYVPDKEPGTGSTIHIYAANRGEILSSRRWEEKWAGMACEGNILFLYTHENNSEMCELTADHQIVTIRKRALDPDLLLALPFHYVASTEGVHFCWSNLGAFEPRIRTLTRAGFLVTKAVTLPGDWFYIVPC